MNIGETIKNYKVLVELGRGAFGIVYKVQDIKDGQIYALKVMFLGKMSEAEINANKGEAEILKKLNHPCIVKYKETFNQNNRMYIILEFVDGGNLGQVVDEGMNKGNKIPDKQLLSWTCQICLGIHHIHSNNIIHRDIKPENILLTKNKLIKITDFGISKQLSGGLQRAKTCAGSRLYMAPEISGGKQYTKEVDLWSLGIILYELAALDEPFACIQDVFNAKIHPLPTDVNADLKDIIEGLLNKDPTKRMTTDQILKKECMKETIKAFSKTALSYLKKSGINVIEDTGKESLNNFKDVLQKMHETKIDISGKNKYLSVNLPAPTNLHLIPNKNVMKFISKYHRHPLIKSEKIGIMCDICQKKYEKSINSYYCVECNFNLCEVCKIKENKEKENTQPKVPKIVITPPKEMIKSRFHDHPLIKLEKKNLYCNICQKQFSGVTSSFYCSRCDFDLCNECHEKEKADPKPASSIEEFKSKYHEHVLLKERRTEILCDVCKNDFDLPVYTFFCEKCDFDMCLSCKMKEVSSMGFIMTKRHIHPVKLSQRDYCCDVCGDESDGPSNTYCCFKCDFDMCPKCFEKFK